MAIRITEDCINCGTCEEVCPVKAISEDKEILRRVIDPARCVECVGFYERTMCNVECPVECCLPDPERVETEERLLARAKELCPDRTFTGLPSHFRKKA
ncbi:MAG: 4Fe-4S binding protein [Deltaproteobacteria bacterium]|nr:4Fe-4S binding protein [Deltaproteobacteria bacterium]